MTIEEFYIDKTNDFYIRMINIINYRKKNVLVYINSVKDRPKHYIKCQKHHIIPKAWYNHHGYEIDNSKTNTVYLTPGEHLEVHVLLREYFKAVNDLDMHYAMALAVDRMSNGNPEWIDKIVNNDIEKQLFLTAYEENINYAAEATSYRYKQMTPIERALLNLKISNGWKNMDKDKYDSLCNKRIEIGKKLWTDPAYKTGSIEWKQHLSESLKLAWKNKSEAEKELWKLKLIDNWKNTSNERKLLLRDDQVRILTHRWQMLSNEEKQLHAKKISESYKCKTPTERALLKQRQSEARKKYCASLSDAEKKRISKMRSELIKGRHWMSNDTLMKSKLVKPELINEMLALGWIFGNKVFQYRKLKQQVQQDI